MGSGNLDFAWMGPWGYVLAHYYAKEKWKVDPRSYWKYTEGASHPANEIAVASGQVDLATDYDRNRNAMISAGRIKPESTNVVWTSDPLPNDALAVARHVPADLAERAQQAALAISPALATGTLPPRYTGFVAATHASYAMIERAGVLLGRVKKG